MEINIKKNHLSRIKIYFIMLLFTMCLTTNALFCSTYNLYLDKTTVIESWAISESIVVNKDIDNNTYVKAPSLNKNNSNNETIAKNISSILMITAIPKGINLFLLIIVFLLFFLTLFILLPDGWTLINQKVRLDN